MQVKPISIGIVGGTGYTGVELLRLLARHPQAELTVITSRGEAGKPVADLFPNLRGHVTLEFTAPDTDAYKDCDVVFFATPNGTAMQSARELLDAGVKVIDLAADFRMRDQALWEAWYGMPHACPELLEEAVYGLPEIYREAVRDARLVANPGCYPTAVQLGLLPLLEAGLIDPDTLIADCKSGVSGAGRKGAIPILQAESAENFKAYNVPGHRHGAEITHCFERLGKPIGFTFVPHLTPMIRGIHATLYARTEVSEEALYAPFVSRYANEPFVDVLPPGAHPETRSVRGVNTCRIAVHHPGGKGTAVILSVIDNLVKGAAGQAVQNMNLMFGLPEDTGLQDVATMP